MEFCVKLEITKMLKTVHIEHRNWGFRINPMFQWKYLKYGWILVKMIFIQDKTVFRCYGLNVEAILSCDVSSTFWPQWATKDRRDATILDELHNYFLYVKAQKNNFRNTDGCGRLNCLMAPTTVEIFADISKVSYPNCCSTI